MAEPILIAVVPPIPPPGDGRSAVRMLLVQCSAALAMERELIVALVIAIIRGCFISPQRAAIKLVSPTATLRPLIVTSFSWPSRVGALAPEGCIASPHVTAVAALYSWPQANWVDLGRVIAPVYYEGLLRNPESRADMRSRARLSTLCPRVGP